MPYITYVIYNKIPRAKYISLFFLFVISGLAILPFSISKAQEPISGKVSAVIATPAVRFNTLIKKIPKKVTVVVPKKVEVSAEAHLKIPRIGVNAVIKEMGMTSDGAMAVPSNSTDVGWFSLGTRPGEIGSAVIGAHNRFDSKVGVFAYLDQLQKGDVLSVIDTNGVSISFVVRDMRTYDATDANTGIFGSKSGVHLNLITCSGDWNPSTNSSTKRLVIFTDIVEATNEIAMVPIK